MAAEARNGTCLPSISIFAVMPISLHRLLGCCCFLRSGIGSRQIDRLIPVGVHRSIGGVARLGFDYTIRQRRSLDGQRLRLNFLAVLVGLTLDAGAGCGTVIQHMANVLLVTIKLKEQGECCQFRIGILDENSLAVQLLTKDIRAEGLRDHRQFQVTVIAHIVVDDVIGHAIGVEVLRLTVGIQGDGHGTGHGDGGTIGGGAVLTQSQQCIMGVFQVEFHLVCFISHRSNLHFKCVEDFVEFFTPNPDLRFVIKNLAVIQNGFNRLFQRGILFVCVQFQMNDGHLMIDLAIRCKVMTSRQQITDEGRINCLALRKMVIGKRKPGILQHFQKFIHVQDSFQSPAPIARCPSVRRGQCEPALPPDHRHAWRDHAPAGAPADSGW
nr:MAG TPA: hypothetical protein [Caudoviricetes sp.]